MKNLLIASLFLGLSAPTAYAAEGFFSCVSDAGTIISAGMDGEVNLSNLRAQTANLDNSKALSVYEITVESGKFELRAHEIQGEEDNTGYDIRTRKLNGSFYKGTLQSNNGEALGPKENVICAVKFYATERE